MLRAYQRVLVAALACLWLIVATPATRAAIIPFGEGTPVDPSTLAQATPDLAVSATGAALLVWQAPDHSGGIDVVAQLRLPGGAIRQFTVHEDRAGSQVGPSAAMAATGDFAVAWERPRPGGEAAVYVRFFDPSGAPLGLEQMVGQAPGGTDRAPDLAMSPDGRAILVWQSWVRSGRGLGSMAWRVVAASYTPDGAQERSWRVGDAIEGDQTRPRVAMVAPDRYAIAWEQLPPQLKTPPPDGNAMKVYLALTTPAGTVEERAGAAQTGDQREPDVALDAAGNLAVAWSRRGGAGDEVFVRAYPAGGPAGAAFPVSAPAEGGQRWPALALGPGGDILVAWQSGGASGQPAMALARSFSATGAPHGPSFPLPSSDGRRALFPRVALRPDGSGLALWHSLPAAGFSPLVYGRRLGPPIEREPVPGPIERTPAPSTPIPPTPIPSTPGAPHRVMLPLVLGA